jgi:hypothetical protein
LKLEPEIMSVAHLDRSDLAAFAAAAVRHNLAALGEIADLLATVATANAAALAEQYGDAVDPADAADIESEALDILAGRIDAGGWPPLAYNCATNAGRDFLPAEAADRLRFIEQECRRISDREEQHAARAEKNAAAYNDVPRLPTADADAIGKAMADANADRVIVATFRVDETDTQTDYFGHRTARSVVIGFGRGKRESFSQLRKAAAHFPPTRDYGPGLGRWYATATIGADCILGSGEHMYEGSRSPWHYDDHAGPFPTRAAAEAHAAARPLAALSITQPDGAAQVVPLVWRIAEEKIEHRENYSMGGGNYLGDGRHGGWVVSSSAYIPTAAELFSVAAFGTKAAKA